MKRPGYLLKTKTGKKGRTYHDEEPVSGKIRVHLLQCHICGGEGDHNGDCGARGPLIAVSGIKLLCEEESLQITGFID
jgi:hypothetical protein